MSFTENIKSGIAVIFQKKEMWYFFVSCFFVIAVLFFLDKGLAVAALLVAFLTLATFCILRGFGLTEKKVYILFMIALAIHLCAILFIYYTGFRPAGGGADFEGYHQNAIVVAERFSEGNFSLEGLYTNHYFPVLIGIIYIFTLPKMIVGQFFVGFLAALSVLLAYFLVLEIKGSKKSAFLTGLIFTLYASFLYFGSLLLKDTVIIPLLLAGLLLSVKMYKQFSIFKFLGFFVALTGAIHLRFYVGFALMFSFIICWFLISTVSIKKRMVYGCVIVIILGFSPMMLGYGYYGLTPLKIYLNQELITKYRSVVYAPDPDSQANNNIVAGKDKSSEDTNNSFLNEQKASSGSSFIIDPGFNNPFTFVKNYLLSFTYSLLGPFPWQLRYKRHLLFLAETIPWYILWFFALYGMHDFIKKNGFYLFLVKNKFALPLVLFSIMALGALSLYISNFGIIARIRMPMVIALLCMMALNINFSLPWKHRNT